MPTIRNRAPFEIRVSHHPELNCSVKTEETAEKRLAEVRAKGFDSRLKQKDEGRWEVQIRQTDGGGKPIADYNPLPTSAEAEKWGRERKSQLRASISRGTALSSDASKLTRGDALDKYRKEMTLDEPIQGKSKKQGAPVEVYRIEALRKHPLAQRPLISLTLADVVSLRNELQKAGQKPSTVRKPLSLLSESSSSPKRGQRPQNRPFRRNCCLAYTDLIGGQVSVMIDGMP